MRLHQHRRQRPRLPQAEGSHDFQHLVNAVAADVTDPADRRAGRRAGCAPRCSPARYDRARRAPTPPTRRGARRAATCRSAALGSGSDYSAFLQHLGVAVARPRLRRRGRGGRRLPLGLRQLRSLHAVRRSGPQLWRGPGQDGRAASCCAIADADTPPLRFGDFADTVGALPRRGEEARRRRGARQDARAQGCSRDGASPLAERSARSRSARRSRRDADAACRLRRARRRGRPAERRARRPSTPRSPAR